jgi:PII-like signaling protein
MPGPASSRPAPALELSVYLLAGDRLSGRPLHRMLLDRALAAGLAGATVSLGMLGFGASGQWHRSGLRGPGVSAPVLFQVIGPEAAIRAFVAEIDQLIESGLITLRPAAVIRRAADGLAGDAAPAGSGQPPA